MITENIYKSIRTLRHFAPVELSGFSLYFQTPEVRLRNKVVACRWTAICKGGDVHQQECFTFEELEELPYSKVTLERVLERSLERFRKYWVRSWIKIRVLNKGR